MCRLDLFFSLLAGGRLYTRESSKPGKSGRHIERVSGRSGTIDKARGRGVRERREERREEVFSLAHPRSSTNSSNMAGFELSRVYKLPPASRVLFFFKAGSF